MLTIGRGAATESEAEESGRCFLFFVGGGIVYLFTALTMGVWFPKLCLLAAFGSAIGVYTIFDKLDLIPEDPDKIITLSLTAPPPTNEPWVSGDFKK